MSFFRELLKKRLWSSVVLTWVVVLALTACGAWLTAHGLWPVERAWLLVCGTWLVSCFVGSHRAAAEEGGVLWRCALTALLALGLLWLLGLTTPGGAELSRRLWYGGSALLGAVAAAMMPPRKRHSRKRKTRARR